MPAVIVDQVQARLVLLLAARSGLAGVQVSDGFTGEDESQPERIFTADARSTEMTPSGLKAGRTHYHEKAELDVVCQVLTIDGSPAEAKARVQQLNAELAQCVADNRYLQGTVGALSGLNWIVSARWELLTRYGATGGAVAELTHTFRYEAHLT